MKSKGFSLIELIATVAILAIAATLIASSFSSVHIKNMQKCSSELDALLSRARVSAMSRAGDVYLRLRQDETGVYAACCERGEDGTVCEEEKIGKSMLSLSWKDNAGVSCSLPSHTLYLAFDRGTGALLSLSRSYAMAGQSGTDTYCTEITVSYGERSRKVVLVPVTGKHHITAD